MPKLILNETERANIQRVLSRLAYVFDQTKPDYYDPARNTLDALVEEYHRFESYVRRPMSAAFQFKNALAAELPLHREQIQKSENFPLREVLSFFEEETSAHGESVPEEPVHQEAERDFALA